mgnify:CR=1 FL=1
MARIGIKDLAQVLIDKYGLDRRAAESFIKAAFDTLGHGLEAERMVKVRGLGTFKVQAVAPRRSVNVNTGEAIVIDGRDKISFTPDNSLRDQVNRPFEQFGTVELNDGVDFTAIDQRFAMEETAASTEAPLAPLAAEVPAAVEQEPTAEEPAAVEQEPAVVEEPAAVEQEPAVVEELAAVEQEPAPEEEPAVEEPVVEEEPATFEEPAGTEEEPSDETEQLMEEVSRQHRLVTWLIAAVVALFLIGGGAAVYLYLELGKRNNRIEHLETQLAVKAPQKSPVSSPAATTSTAAPQPDAIEAANNAQQAEEQATEQQPKAPSAAAPAAPATQPKAAAQAMATAQAMAPTAQPQTAPAKQPEAKPSIPDQTAYAKDARVRMGAYYIMGIDHKVTVRPGETLYSLSRRTLGPGMECYIEAVNGGRTDLKAGEKINIPKLKVKKRHKK